jgi:hypothetical protein
VHGSAVFPRAARLPSPPSRTPSALPSILAASFDGADPPPSNLARGSSTRESSNGWFHAVLESSSRDFLRWCASFDGQPRSGSLESRPRIPHPRIKQRRQPSILESSNRGLLRWRSFLRRPAPQRLPSNPARTLPRIPAICRSPTMEGVMPVLVIRRGAIHT